MSRSGDNKNLRAKPVCEMCHLMCLECFGPAPNQCKTCPSGYIKTPNSTCVQYVKTYGRHQIDTTNIVIVVFVCLAAGTVFLFVFLCLQAREYGYCSVTKCTGVCLEEGKTKWKPVDLTDSEEEQFSKQELLNSNDDFE